MWSQRRHITDVEIYGKNAERFLSLRPSFENKNDKSDRYEFNNCVEGNSDEKKIQYQTCHIN